MFRLPMVLLPFAGGTLSTFVTILLAHC